MPYGGRFLSLTFIPIALFTSIYCYLTMLESLDSISLQREVVAILTYDGSQENILINYVMLLITLYTLLLLQKVSKLPHYLIFLVFSSVFLAGYQVGLCLIVQCVGISIIWSAYSGMIYSILHDHSKRSDEVVDENIMFQVRFQFLAVLIVWVYYLLIEDIITTVAHILAFILGIGITYFHIWINKRNKTYESINAS